MQMYWSESFKSRVLLNASKAYVMQLDKAEEFKLLKPVYALNFVNDTFEQSPEMKDEYYHLYKIVNIKNTEKRIEGLEFLFLELPKFKPMNRAEKKLHELWLRFLTEINKSTKEIPAELLDNEYTREAVGYMEKSAYTKEQLAVYDKWKIAAMTERSAINDALQKGEAIGIEKGEAIGLQKGEAIGIEKGEAIGIEKGEAIGRTAEKEQVVINSHHAGLSAETISNITELTIEQIIEILKRHGFLPPAVQY
jgi:predicted transposase/invertase (TIGR01784 family)